MSQAEVYKQFQSFLVRVSAHFTTGNASYEGKTMGLVGGKVDWLCQ